MPDASLEPATYTYCVYEKRKIKATLLERFKLLFVDSFYIEPPLNGGTKGGMIVKKLGSKTFLVGEYVYKTLTFEPYA